MRILNYFRQIRSLTPILPFKKTEPSIPIYCQPQSTQFSSFNEKWKTRVDPEVLKKARRLAERAADSWTVQRTSFLSPLEVRAVLQDIEHLAEVDGLPFGGYPHAERQRIMIMREELLDSHKSDLENTSEITPVKIEGNFLMVKCESADFLSALTEVGLKSRDLGDVIVMKDIGGFVFTTLEASSLIEKRLQTVRSVGVQVKKIPFGGLPALNSRIKEIKSVEASLRLDAITSAAFGVSRDKVAAAIKAGDVQLNWEVVKKPTEVVEQGDAISLKGKGRAIVEQVETTKKQKYSIKITRVF